MTITDRDQVGTARISNTPIQLNGEPSLGYRIGTSDRTLGAATSAPAGFLVLNTTNGNTFTPSGGIWTSVASPMIGFWSLNEGTGSTAYDTSGNNNNGTWNGTPDGTSGYYSRGVPTLWAGNFDGSTDYITHAHISAFDFGTDDFSIAFWINPVSLEMGFTQGIIGQKLNDTSPGFQIYHDSGDADQIRLRLGDTSNIDTITTNGSIPDGVWTFCTAVRQSGTAYWYINGELNVSGANAKNIGGGSANFNIGIGDTWSDSFFGGLLDDIRIYNRALSSAEVYLLSQGLIVDGTFPDYLYDAWMAATTAVDPDTYRFCTSDRSGSTVAPDGFLIINTTDNQVFQVQSGAWVNVTSTFNSTTLSNLLAAWSAA